MFAHKKGKIKVLIIGLGGVGYYLAKRLQHEEYAVTAIEPDRDQLRYADESLDIRLVSGEAMDIHCWRQAGAESLDCVVCVTDNDAVNMMAAMIASKFGIRFKIVRVRSLQFGFPNSLLSAEDLTIDLIIHPEEMVAQEIVRTINLQQGNEVIDITSDGLQALATRVAESSALAHRKLKDISSRYAHLTFRVVTIARGISTIIPQGDEEIMPNDQIVVMASRSDLPELMKIAGIPHENRQRVMIFGGGIIGGRVAGLLEKSMAVTLIEANAGRAEKLVDSLAHTEVLHGDGSKAEALQLARVRNFDTFISATEDNETNIMSALLAKNLMLQRQSSASGIAKTIAVVNKEDYQVLAATIGLDIALNTKIMAANEIMRNIRRSELINVAHLHGFDAEAVELVAAPNSLITKWPLAKLDPSYQGKILVGAFYRDGVWQIAVGKTHIRANERVIVICLSMQLNAIRHLFSV